MGVFTLEYLKDCVITTDTIGCLDDEVDGTLRRFTVIGDKTVEVIQKFIIVNNNDLWPDELVRRVAKELVGIKGIIGIYLINKK